MKAIRQKELLCRAMWAYMRSIEELADYTGDECNAISEAKELLTLTDAEIAEINKYGNNLGLSFHGKPVICNL